MCTYPNGDIKLETASSFNFKNVYFSLMRYLPNAHVSNNNNNKYISHSNNYT